MRIAKPMLLVSTPIGVIWGVCVAYQMKPWLAWLMLVLLAVVGAFIAYTVAVIRREKIQASQDASKAPNIET
jgi:phage shock protein PspC (stress-responsive transcriptional regulator)